MLVISCILLKWINGLEHPQIRICGLMLHPRAVTWGQSHSGFAEDQPFNDVKWASFSKNSRTAEPQRETKRVLGCFSSPVHQ
jgi:hypothetical protein